VCSMISFALLMTCLLAHSLEGTVVCIYYCNYVCIFYCTYVCIYYCTYVCIYCCIYYCIYVCIYYYIDWMRISWRQFPLDKLPVWFFSSFFTTVACYWFLIVTTAIISLLFICNYLIMLGDTWLWSGCSNVCWMNNACIELQYS